MDKQWLENYQAKEFEKYQNYIKNFDSSNIKYPNDSKFQNLTDPVIFFDPFSYVNYQEKIWSQIPFSGTLLISLRNCKENDCLKHNGFEVSEIPDLIRFAEETGKIRIGLQTDPILYEDLDYLDDVFTTLDPPLFRTIPFNSITSENNLKKWGIEFQQLAEITYKETMMNVWSEILGNAMAKSRYDQNIGTFYLLKILEMNDVLENIENLMIDDPFLATKQFEKYAIIIGTKFDALTPNVNWGLSELKKFDIEKSEIENVFHPEIGSFLLKQHALNPENYHECRNVIDNYKQNQLYSVYNSLYCSMQNQKYGDLVQYSKEIDEIMNNAWEDGKKLVGRTRTIKIGLDVVVGLCGLALGGLSAFGITGLLAGLGFNVAQNNVPWVSTLSEKITRKIQPDYLVNIYDFYKMKD